MNSSELQALLRERFADENERCEWKEWQSLKSNVSGRKGEDLISYVSALANMEGGCVVIGAQDRTLRPTGIADFADYTAANLPHRVLGKCPNLSSLGLRVEELQAADSGARVWLVHVPRHQARKPVYAHDKAWQRDGDSLVELREERLAAILSEPLIGEDWSAATVAGATFEDLDPEALALARDQYARKHALARWANQIGQWDDKTFLDRARLTAQGLLTRAALLLLGRPECVRLLQPHPAEITWKLMSERAVQHFGPPFLLSTSDLLRRIRNPVIKLFPQDELVPFQVPRYDTRLVLEALHNSVAHQDYTRGERIVVEEWPTRLSVLNAGGFVDGQPEDYFEGTRTPTLYRNAWLAHAMDEIGMIDKAGFGIRDMVRVQRERFLPLPDYVGSTLTHTRFNVEGRELNHNYSHLLMTHTDIDVATVLLLDRLQKGHELNAQQRQHLRTRGLLEGRGKRATVSAGVAMATGQEPEYIDASGLDAQHFRALVLRLLAMGPQSRAKINRLLLDKLPATIVGNKKRGEYVKGLLQDMVRRREIENVGGATKAARWALTKQQE